MTMNKLFILTLFFSNMASAQSLLISQGSKVAPVPLEAMPAPSKAMSGKQGPMLVPSQVTMPNTVKTPGAAKASGRMNFAPAQNGVKLNGDVGNLYNATQQHMAGQQLQGLPQHQGVPFSNHYSDVAGNSSRQIKSGSGVGVSYQGSREYNKAMNRLERNVNGVIANPANDRRNTVFGAGIDFE